MIIINKNIMIKFNLFNFEKILIKLGFKKKHKKSPIIGIDIKNSSNIKMRRIRGIGVDKLINAENVTSIDIEGVESKK